MTGVKIYEYSCICNSFTILETASDKSFHISISYPLAYCVHQTLAPKDQTMFWVDMGMVPLNKFDMFVVLRNMETRLSGNAPLCLFPPEKW